MDVFESTPAARCSSIGLAAGCGVGLTGCGYAPRPRVGAPGATLSLTPTAVTTFLLDLWPAPGLAVADPNGWRRHQSCEHSTPESSVQGLLVAAPGGFAC